MAAQHAFRRFVAAKGFMDPKMLAVIVDSIIVSTCMYGAHLRSVLNVRDTKSVRGQFLAAYQAASRTWPKKRNGVWEYTSPEKTLLLVGRLDARAYTAVNRLRFFAHVCAYGTSTLLARLIHLIAVDPGGWPAALAADLLWLRRHREGLQHLPDPAEPED